MSRVNPLISKATQEIIQKTSLTKENDGYEIAVIADVIAGENNTLYTRHQRDIMLQIRPNAKITNNDGWYIVKL